MLNSVIDTLQTVLNLAQLITRDRFLTGARRGSARQRRAQTLLKVKPCAFLVDKGLLLEHELRGERLVHRDLLLQLVGQLFDLLLELALVHRSLRARFLVLFLDLSL